MKARKPRRRYQRPYHYDPPRVACLVELPARYAHALDAWAAEEQRSRSSLIAELLQPVFDEMDKTLRPEVRRRK